MKSKSVIAAALPVLALAPTLFIQSAHALDAETPTPAPLAQNEPDISRRATVEDAQPTGITPSPSHQAQSLGFFTDSHLDLLLRNYSDVQDVDGGPHRHAWIQAAQANYTSGFTQGLIGFGLDASLFGAFRLDGGAGAGNMAHVGRHGGGADQIAWAYPGQYAVKARVSETVVKYGLQIINNPFLVPHDNRALPPTFLGVSLASRELSKLSLEAGSFTKSDGRGQTHLGTLKTAYGHVAFKRLSYLGGNWDYAPDGTLSLYADQADDVWRQYYAALTHSLGSAETLRWTGAGSLYSTHGAGDARQGPINSNAYSLALTAQHKAHALMLGYQQVLGDQFFDYVDETNGIYLANSMDVDYNAPHERSLQVRYSIDGNYLGVPGFKAMVWYLAGWGADASAEAARHASPESPRHGLYWRNGQPLHGSHHEFGLVPTYTVQGGRFKDTNITLVAMWHHASRYYPDAGNMEYRLIVNLPLKVF